MKKPTLFIAMLLFTAFNYSAQAVESHTVACTAGNLATLTLGYLTTVTDLTVTGTIDARDFKTMRDDMPLLAVIDLSGSAVEAYTGIEGPIGTTDDNSAVYLANEIPYYAFHYLSSDMGKISLNTFVFPSSVTTIGHLAFSGCSGLKGSLAIPSSVTTIADYAFSYCSGLTGSLTIPSSVSSIGFGAFWGCGFTGSLTIPSSVNTLGPNAFFGCGGFSGSLSISASITTILNGTFSGCAGFKGLLTLPSSITNIESDAFWGCGFTGLLTIPSSVINIGSSAFEACMGFTGSLTIPSSVTIIGEYAFGSCTGFTGSLIIPSSVTLIGNYAFENFSALIEVDPSNSNYSSLDGVLYNKNKTILLQCPRSITGSFSIPSSVITIENRAFQNCTGLTGSLTIPSSVKSIGDAAFGNCRDLSSIYAYATTPIDINASTGVFSVVNTTTCVLHVPVGAKVLYAAANQWMDFNIVEDIVPISIVQNQTTSISIFPTPATSSITVSELSSLATDKTVTLLVTDVSGSTLFTQEVEPSINTLTIDISSFKSGIYFIAIRSNNGRVVKRFVKE